jgi:hypothetical protein
LDLSTTSIDEIARIIPIISKGHAVRTPTFLQGKLTLYRGVRIRSGTDILKKQSELTYPPPTVVTKLGRVNRAGQSMFYAANGRHVPFFELNAQPGERMVISQWRNIILIKFNHVGYTNNIFNIKKSVREIPKMARRDMNIY